MARELLSPAVAMANKNIEVVELLTDSIAMTNRPILGLLSNPAVAMTALTDGFTSSIFQAKDGEMFGAQIRMKSGYKVKIKLALNGTTDSRGLIQWEDDGKEYDKYSNSLTFRGMTSQALENILASDSEDPYYMSTPVPNGFYPFGMGFATGQNYPVSIEGNYKGSDVDVFGKLRKYTIQTRSSVTDIYGSLVEATAISDCGRIISGWTIGGVPFTFAKWVQSNNDQKRIVGAGGGTSEIVDTTRTFGDVAKITVTVAEEQARQILQFFTKTMRGTSKSAIFPSIYNIFGRRYEGATGATVKLFSDEITIEHTRPSIVKIGFQLQMVGE
jgi:hypothetical protein